jgi:hypothetical protein
MTNQPTTAPLLPCNTKEIRARIHTLLDLDETTTTQLNHLLDALAARVERDTVLDVLTCVENGLGDDAAQHLKDLNPSLDLD